MNERLEVIFIIIILYLFIAKKRRTNVFFLFTRKRTSRTRSTTYKLFNKLNYNIRNIIMLTFLRLRGLSTDLLISSSNYLNTCF